MDLDQLKLILQTVQGVSNGALTFAILWLVKDILLTGVGYIFGVFVVKKIFEAITMGITRTQLHKMLMTEIGANVYLDDGDQKRVVELVRKGLEAEKSKTRG